MKIEIVQPRIYSLQLTEEELNVIRRSLSNANYWHQDCIDKMGGTEVERQAVKAHEQSIITNSDLLNLII